MTSPKPWSDKFDKAIAKSTSGEWEEPENAEEYDYEKAVVGDAARALLRSVRFLKNDEQRAKVKAAVEVLKENYGDGWEKFVVAEVKL